MTAAQEKMLVNLLLHHDEHIEQHAAILLTHLRILNNLTGDNEPTLFPNAVRNPKSYIESLIERQEAVTRDKTELRKNLQAFFELDDPATLNPQPATE